MLIQITNFSKRVILIAIVFISFGNPAQSQLVIPSARPRVYLTPEDIPVLREKVKTERFREAWETVKSSDHPFGMALRSLITGDTALAARAAVEFLPLLQKSVNARTPLSEIQLGACIYDWCYDQMDKSLRQDYINEFKRISNLHAPWFPARKGHNALVGHDTEGWLLCGQLPAGLAIYDEESEMFDAASNVFFDEFVPARELVYKAHMHHQGDSYGMDRFVHDLFATWLFHKFGREVFPENQKYVPYQIVYNMRPDGRQMRSGDNYDLRGSSTRKSKTLLISGSLYSDPYQLELYKAFSVGGIRKMLELVFLPLDDISKPLNELPLTKYFPHPMGEMIHRTRWEMGDNSTDALVHMRIGNYYFGNHQAKDFGIFQIWYKGPLAISSGQYVGIKYGSAHWRNYHHQTISKNGLLIFDPDENIPNNDVNDGGQRYPSAEGSGNPRNLEHLLDEKQGFKMAEVTAHSFGPDKSKPHFSYISGDITRAYSPHKAELVTRSMLTINTGDVVYPALFFVFDRVRSSNPAFRKTWLIHSIQEPTVNKDIITIISDGISPDNTRNYNGKLISKTLHPENVVIEKIGGEGRDFWIESSQTNYSPEGATTEDPEKGEWRVEVSPSEPAKEDVFFHAMAVTQAGNNEAFSFDKLNVPNFTGVALQEYAVFFPAKEGLQNQFVYKAESKLKGLFIAGLKPGTWEIRQKGTPVLFKTVSGDEKCIFIENIKMGKISIRYVGLDDRIK